MNKKRLIEDFRLMRDFEKSARDQYLKISQDPLAKKAGISGDFELISNDEQNHVKIAEKIIKLIEMKL